MKKGTSRDGTVFHTGFPNAAEDHAGQFLSLDKHVFRHRLSTYLWQLEHDLPELLWSAGSVVVVDRALVPRAGDYIVAIVDEQFTVRIFQTQGLRQVSGEREVATNIEVWGVITHVLQEFRAS